MDQKATTAQTTPKEPKKGLNIAIIGTGISGLVTAYLLNRQHNIRVFEARDRLGGHTHTVDVKESEEVLNIDTGFIVFNELTYPNFLKLLNTLNVPYQASDMSFSVMCENRGLEYNGTSINKLFAQRRNLLRPSFHKMISEILRFNKETKEFLANHPKNISLGQFLEQQGYHSHFIEDYLIPMTAAIWSANPQKLMSFPFKFLAQFFDNHRFLEINDRPVWQVVKGGSRQYVKAITESFEDKIMLNTPVEKVQHTASGVEVTSKTGKQLFDHVVIATHADQALKFLAEPTPNEVEILNQFKFQKNEAILHTDTNIMPKRSLAWASWNYFLSKKPQSQACVTYHMNALQNLKAQKDYMVSLNAKEHLNQDKIIKSFTYYHPIFNAGSFESQSRHHEISGVRNIHYAGAYWGYGFHEDGVNSALKVCRYFGESLA